MFRTAWIAAAAAAIAVVPVEAGTIRYVDDDAPPGGDGLSWNTAHRFLQDALTAASNPANGILMIRVAQGLYLPDHSEANPNGTGDLNARFHLVPGVLHLGGFAGLGAADPNFRDAAVYPAVLSGDLNGNAQHDPGDSAVVVHASGGVLVLVIDGFTITLGRDAGFVGSSPLVVSDCALVNNVVSPSTGSALMISPGSTGPLVVTDCTFSGNFGVIGGAVLYENPDPPPLTPTIDGCTFLGNTATAGGAIYARGPISVVASTFSGNSAASGGAVYCLSGVATFDACEFLNNASTTDGGALYLSASSPSTVRNCFFDGNHSDASGGAVSASTGGLAFVDCVFNENSAGITGGAMRMLQSSATIVLCTYIGNSAGGGGAIHVDLGNPLIANCLFAENVAVLGAAVNNFAGDLTLINCTLSQNAASDSGGGIYNARGAPSVRNCVLWGNSDLGGMDESAQIDGVVTLPDVNYSVVQGGWSGGGIGNIASDPMFAEPTSGDFSLLPGSPCIDAGDSNVVPVDVFDVDDDGNTGERLPLDLDGNPRFVDDPNTPDTGCGLPAVVDMGAYEFDGVSFEMNVGDLDGDGGVDVKDFLDLLAVWGSCPDECCLADLDNDGFVGVTDFLTLLENWG